MKILAVASGGGHWIELLRLKPVFTGHDTYYLTTNKEFESTVKGEKFYYVPDVSRWNKLKFLVVAMKMNSIIRKIKPDIIISTGAAPGVVSMVLGKLAGARTIWVDSMCHVRKLSLSGKISSWFTDRVYTQWPHLAGKKVFYKGNVMS
jgi:UDP-N-acetylglucosamine:LPS N-acetylglucosamine transferase